MRLKSLMQPRLDAPFPTWMIFPVVFAALYASHFTLLRLPYYWDEAGYYIPAAWDFFRTGSLIPISTLTNAHPPLPSIYLAFWWKISGFYPEVTREAVLIVASFALLGVWRLAMRLVGVISVAMLSLGLLIPGRALVALREPLLSRAKMLPLNFDHRKHTSINCLVCHHNYADGRGFDACIFCHRSARTDLKVGVEARFHDFCLNCHRHPGPTLPRHGPVSGCTICHQPPAP